MNMQEPEPRELAGREYWSSKKTWLSEGLIVLSVPALAYLLSFFYELGYVSYFGVPWQLISPTYVSISIALFSLIIFGVVVMYLFNSSFRLLHEVTQGYPALRYVPFAWGIYIALLAPILVLIHMPTATIWIFSGLLILVLALKDFVARPLLRKLESLPPGGSESAEYVRLNGPLAKFRSRFGFSVGTAAALGFYLLFFSLLLGADMAGSEKNFLVIETDPPMAVLRIYGDTMIAATYNLQMKTIGKRFAVLKLGEETKTPLNLEEIGPLHGEGRVPLPQ